MAERKIGVALTADMTGLQRGLSAGSSATTQFAASAENSFQRATTASANFSASADLVSKSVDGIGLAQRAQSAAAERFVRDLERQVSMLGKTRAEIMQMQAAQLGVADRAAPLISRLNATSGAMEKTGMSAAQMSMAMRQLPMQFTDIATSLVSGMPLYMIAVQQGGQIRDSFGGIGASLKAIGSLITPTRILFGGLAAAVGAVGFAAYQGRENWLELNRTLIASGNAAGVTAGQLRDVSNRVGDLTGSYGYAREAAIELARTGVAAGEDLERVMAGVVAAAELTGESVEALVGQYAAIAKDPVKAIEELNEKHGYFTFELYRQVQALQEQGRTAEAVSLTQGALADDTQRRLSEVDASLGTVERAWNAVANKAREAWNAMLNFGTPESLESLRQTEASLALQIAGFEANPDGFAETEAGAVTGGGANRSSERLKAIQAQYDIITAEIARREAAITATEERAAQERAERQKFVADKGLREMEASLQTREERRKADIKQARAWAAEVGKSEEEVAELIARINQKYSSQSGGGISASQTELTNLRARIEAEKLLATQLASTSTVVTKLNEGERLSLQYAEKLKSATDAKTKSRLADLKAMADELGALQRTNEAALELAEQREKEQEDQLALIDTLTQKAIALEDEIAVYGLGKAAIERMALARLENRKAALVEMGATEDVIELIDREIEARKRLMAATAGKEVLDANRKASEQAVKDWERSSDQIGRSLTDALMRGFESGKDAAENLRDTVVNMFKTLVLRPIIEPDMKGFAGSMTSALGFAPSSSQAAGMVGPNLFTNFGGNVGQWAQGFGHSLWEGGGAFADIGKSMADSAFEIGRFADIAGDVFGYGKAIYDITQGNYGAAAGTAIGTAVGGPVGAAIGSMLGGLLDNAFKGETRFGGGYTRDRATSIYARTGGPSGGDPSEAQTIQSVSAVFQTVTDIVTRMGGQMGLLDFGGGWELSPEKGNSFVWGGWTREGEPLRYSDHRRDLDTKDMNTVAAEFAIEMQRSIIEGLKLANLEGAFADYLSTINADLLDAAGVEHVLAHIDAMMRFRDALEQLPFADLAGVTLDAGMKMAEFSGGIDVLLGNMQTYYDLVYSEEEKALHLQERLTNVFRNLGYELPQSTQALRELVESLDVTTDAGLRARAEIYAVAGAFGQLQDMLASLAGEATDLNAAFDAQAQIVRSVASEVNRLYGLRSTAGNLLDRMNRNTLFSGQRETQLWASLETANAEQQIQLASELYELIQQRYDTEMQAVEALENAYKNIRRYADSLLLGDLSPLTVSEQLDEAGRQYADLLAKARGGDVDAINQLPSAADAYLELARQAYASSPEYTRIFDYVIGSLDGLAGQTQSDAERQLAVSQQTLSQIETLKGVVENAYASIDAQYQAGLLSLTNETHILTELGAQTGRLNEVADILRGLPAEIAANLQPLLSSALNTAVMNLYEGSGITPDQSAMDYWTGQLGSRPAGQVSDDFYRTLVDNWYKDNLGWSGDLEGINYWADQAKALGTAQAYEDFLRTAGINSHRDGLSFVPYDEYPAMLHRGERVLTAGENRMFSMPDWSTYGRNGTEALLAEIRKQRETIEKLTTVVEALRHDNNAGHAANVNAHGQTAEKLAEVVESARLESKREQLSQPRR